jgi:hypothetical protein
MLINSRYMRLKKKHVNWYPSEYIRQASNKLDLGKVDDIMPH